jgi:hypothetical protein
MADAQRPNDYVLSGRLSYPAFTMPEALALNENGKKEYKKTADKVKTHYNLLVTEAQLNKLLAYVTSEFLPYVETVGKEKGNEKGGLEKPMLTKLKRMIEAQDWEVDPIVGFIKPVSKKTAELAPEAVATVKVNGMKGQDVTRRAIVHDVSELVNQVDVPPIPARGLPLPVGDTNLELYPGAVCAAPINLYAYVTGSTPSITASGPTCILVNSNAERFGGGGEIDEDELFMSIDED